jgi:hypothetical protein
MADASRDITIRHVLTAADRLQVADYPGDGPALDPHARLPDGS